MVSSFLTPPVKKEMTDLVFHWSWIWNDLNTCGSDSYTGKNSYMFWGSLSFMPHALHELGSGKANVLHCKFYLFIFLKIFLHGKTTFSIWSNWSLCLFNIMPKSRLIWVISLFFFSYYIFLFAADTIFDWIIITSPEAGSVFLEAWK